MVIDLFRALRAGQELKNAATWKRAQVWTAHLVILLTCIVSIARSAGYEIPLTEKQITDLVSGFAVLFGLFQSYATVATTERIGLPPAADADQPGSPTESLRDAGADNDYRLF